MKFTWKHFRTDTYILECFNNGQPTDTIITEDTKTYVWNFVNLPACINEQGSRAYTELPYFCYYKHLRDFGKLSADGSRIGVAVPYTWSYVMQPFVGYDFKHDTLYDKDNFAVRKFYNQCVANVADTDAVSKFIYIHKSITDSFKYQIDENLYRYGTDVRMERLSEFLDKKTLREVSRYNLYGKLFYLLNTNYYCAYPQDIRSDEIRLDRFTKIDMTAPYMCLVKDNAINYFSPKSHRFGLNRNEFPFYYEDAAVVLVPQRVPEKQSYEKYKDINFINSRIPFSTVNDNKRITTVMTSVSLDSLKASFDARIKLSGQFSTMQRGYYQYDYNDSTVNEQYFEGVNDGLKGVKIISKEMVSCDNDFPFTAEFRLKYNSDKIIDKATDATYEIDIAQWFKHIYLPEFTAAGRVTSFYPDFLYFDEYKYYIKFDKPASLLDTVPFNFEIENELGVYKIKSTQVQPDVILLQSDFIVKSAKVPADKVQSVQTIYNFIEQLDKNKLKIKAL